MPTAKPTARTTARKNVLVDFALQGGGSHGAFTWGALDRMLEEPWLEIEAISGTSAGAMNAAVLADGYAQDGAQGAKAALEKFWRAVSDAARMSPLRRGPLDVLLGRWSLDNSPVFIAMDLMTRLFSPYDFPSGATNPLTDILAECVDFPRLVREEFGEVRTVGAAVRARPSLRPRPTPAGCSPRAPAVRPLS